MGCALGISEALLALRSWGGTRPRGPPSGDSILPHPYSLGFLPRSPKEEELTMWSFAKGNSCLQLWVKYCMW